MEERSNNNDRSYTVKSEASIANELGILKDKETIIITNSLISVIESNKLEVINSFQFYIISTNDTNCILIELITTFKFNTMIISENIKLIDNQKTMIDSQNIIIVTYKLDLKIFKKNLKITHEEKRKKHIQVRINKINKR